MNGANSKVEVFGSINEIMDKYNQIQVPYEQLKGLEVDHILVREAGFLRFSLISDNKGVFKMIEKNFEGFIQELIPGFKGVYGYLGVNPDLLNNIKKHKQETSESKVYIVSVDYEGPYYVVNSGRFGGMVIISENYQNLNFKNMKS